MIPQPCSRHLKRLLFNIDLGQADYDTQEMPHLVTNNWHLALARHHGTVWWNLTFSVGVSGDGFNIHLSGSVTVKTSLALLSDRE